MTATTDNVTRPLKAHTRRVENTVVGLNLVTSMRTKDRVCLQAIPIADNIHRTACIYVRVLHLTQCNREHLDRATVTAKRTSVKGKGQRELKTINAERSIPKGSLGWESGRRL